MKNPREIDAAFEDAVFEAGCHADAALGQRGATVYLEFDRSAPELLEAVISAIQTVHHLFRRSRRAQAPEPPPPSPNLPSSPRAP